MNNLNLNLDMAMGLVNYPSNNLSRLQYVLAVLKQVVAIVLKDQWRSFSISKAACSRVIFFVSCNRYRLMTRFTDC